MENIGNLKKVIKNYGEIVKRMNNRLQSNNVKFCKEFKKLVKEIVGVIK